MLQVWLKVCRKRAGQEDPGLQMCGDCHLCRPKHTQGTANPPPAGAVQTPPGTSGGKPLGSHHSKAKNPHHCKAHRHPDCRPLLHHPAGRTNFSGGFRRGVCIRDYMQKETGGRRKGDQGTAMGDRESHARAMPSMQRTALQVRLH